MKRRTFVASLGGLAVVGGVTFGSGAFDQAEATRGISISTTVDDDALIRLVPGPGDDGNFVSGHETGPVTIEIDAVENGAEPGNGVNDGSVTVFPELLQIQNQGSDPVVISAEEPPDAGIVFFGEEGFDGPDSIAQLEATLTPGSSTNAGLAVDAGYGTDQVPGTVANGDSIEVVIRADAE
ncbi:hypothetical protein [Salinarchaeum laminariae]|uniref:hypothetical protein n=1 Tax=Salinarchaeum laminariae TaxID=869888 RepID=UPI0020BE0FB7|nr:hypothetical protein [Salinarchaeum laminariae]